MTKILVFDSNIVFSKRVKHVIEEAVANAVVDIAHNVPLLSYRLKHRKYDLVLADVLTAQEKTKAEEVLRSANDSGSYVALWSPLTRDGFQKKPTINGDFKEAIEPYLITVSGVKND